ncbi:similar to transcription factor Zn, C2H2, partial sequence [Botrytis cinerea T4]|uniref:Similar to transcription factor Zn, C2H2, partial sequence n=1 Tax=Botryotinia fuckeliana (strain T4) TaxID=999810 RepID=G2YI06_BOTF4
MNTMEDITPCPLWNFPGEVDGAYALSSFDEQLQTPELEQDGNHSDFQPRVSWNHCQYSENHTSAQQSTVDPLYWTEQLPSTGIDSNQDPETDHSSFPGTSISHQTGKQQTASM